MHSIKCLVKLQESLHFSSSYLVSTRTKIRVQHCGVVDIWGTGLSSTNNFSAENGHENNR